MDYEGIGKTIQKNRSENRENCKNQIQIAAPHVNKND